MENKSSKKFFFYQKGKRKEEKCLERKVKEKRESTCFSCST